MIYEVNLVIPTAIREEYNHWLHTHIEEMCTFEGFLKAEVYQNNMSQKTSQDRNTHYEVCVQYHLKTFHTLRKYEKQHAERMRGDGISKWGTQVQASRRILEPYILR